MSVYWVWIVVTFYSRKSFNGQGYTKVQRHVIPEFVMISNLSNMNQTDLHVNLLKAWDQIMNIIEKKLRPNWNKKFHSKNRIKYLLIKNKRGSSRLRRSRNFIWFKFDTKLRMETDAENENRSQNLTWGRSCDNCRVSHHNAYSLIARFTFPLSFVLL